MVARLRDALGRLGLWGIAYYATLTFVASIFIGGFAAAFLEPSATAEAGHCYRIEARHGFLGYLAGHKHVEIACP